MNSVSSVVGVVKAQEDVTGGQKRDGEVEEEEEDPYNEENLEQVGSRWVLALSLFTALSTIMASLHQKEFSSVVLEMR